MKNKWGKALLIGLTVFSLCACGKNAEPEKQEEEKTENTETENAGEAEENLTAAGQETAKEQQGGQATQEETEDPEEKPQDLTQLPDFDEQIDLIVQKRSDWMLEEESWDNPSYAVTDLDGNGRLEIMYEQLQGTGRFTDMAIYEVSEDKKSLVSGYGSEDSYGGDAPDVGDDNVVTMIEQDGTVHYLFKDGTKNGIAEFYETTCDVTFSDGRWHEKDLGYYSAIYENYYTDEAAEDELKETYENAAQEPITEEEYRNLGREAYPGAQEDVAVLGWFNKLAYFGRPKGKPFRIKEDYSREEVYEESVKVSALEDEELREQLTASAGVFSNRAQSSWRGPLDMEVQRDYQDGWDEERSVSLYSGYYDMIHLAGVCRSAHPKLEEALNQFNADNYEQLSKTWESLKTDALELQNSGAEELPTLYANDELKVRRADNKVLSFTEYSEEYYGGAHGEGGYFGHNFDVNTGKEITISDVVADTTALTELVWKKLEEKYKDDLFEEAHETVKDSRKYNFTIDPDGLCFYFSPYELAPYAAGMLQVKILFDEAPELFTGAFGKMEGSYCMEFGREQSLLADLDGDGRTDEISAACEEDEYGSYARLYVGLNEESYQDEEYYGYGFSPTLVHLDKDHNFLYLQSVFDNDYEAVIPFDLSGGKIRPLEEYIPGDLSGHLQSYTDNWYGSWRTVMNDPAEVEQICRMDVLSTTSAYRVGRITEKGTLESDEDYLILSQFVLTANMNFAATLLDRDRQEKNGIEITAGETLQIMYTDGENYVDCKLSDGRMVRVRLSGEEWPKRIGRYEVQDVFDGMMFAG